MPLVKEHGAEPIPGYRLLERLGSGGFGEVWKCEAPGGLLKAIKIVQGADPLRGSAGLAEQELKALRRVQSVRHPYLLSIDRHDVIDGRLLIVMELADGSLWDRFRERRANGQPGIPREELLRYLLEAAEVLDLMHGTYQLQHLDIKPQNLFLIHDHVKVGDFGLVKDLQNVQGRLSGGVTPFYAAPETFDGVVSRHCDQYSLAIVYQELLTGMRPVAGDSVQQVILQHLQGTPNLTSLPAADRPAVARALGKKPEDRYPSCLAFVRSLRAGPDATVDLGGPVVATVPAASAASGGTPPPGTSKRMTVAVDTRPTAATEPAAAAPRPERTGAGVLVPAVVVGLGGTGRAVLQRLRQAVVDHVGPPERWPHLRLLYLDTDPEAVRAALDGSVGPALAPDEVLPVRLQRAG